MANYSDPNIMPMNPKLKGEFSTCSVALQTTRKQQIQHYRGLHTEPKRFEALTIKSECVEAERTLLSQYNTLYEYVHIYIRTYIHIYIHIRIYMCTFIHINICVYIYIHKTTYGMHAEYIHTYIHIWGLGCKVSERTLNAGFGFGRLGPTAQQQVGVCENTGP